MKSIAAPFFLFVALSAAPALSAEDPASAPVAPALPAAPAAEAPRTTITIPHSSRTKDNFADIALDFLLTGWFSNFENVTVKYEFMETSLRQSFITFKDFSIVWNRPDIKGTVSFGTFHIGLKDLLNFLKTQVFYVQNVTVEKLKVDLTPVKENGEKARRVRASAAKIVLQNANLYAQGKGPTGSAQGDFTVQSVVVEKGTLNLSDPKERYNASSAKAEGVILHAKPPYNVRFTSAAVDGKEYKTFDELKAALEK
ncbi:MAG: hypothetical protein ACI4PW_03285 [Alphaproteobacteria bacterium]|jgi:hypothetical protein